MTFYSDMQAFVDEMLTTYGEPITLRKRTEVTGTKPWRPGTPSQTDYTGHRGAFFPNGIRGPYRLALRPNTEITGSDVLCYVPGIILPEPLRVLATDQIIRADGTAWRVRFADYLDPAGPVLYYELRLCK